VGKDWSSSPGGRFVRDTTRQPLDGSGLPPGRNYLLNKRAGNGRAQTAPVSRRYCECGRERAALEKEFGPGLTGHLVLCAACGGTAHHTGEYTVCMKCGRYEQSGATASDTPGSSQEGCKQPITAGTKGER
jgi:hypothetical protein